jgi:hypothetical protein
MPAPTTPGGHSSLRSADRGSEFLVRFDRPVGHVHSTLAITRDGKLVEDQMRHASTRSIQRGADAGDGLVAANSLAPRQFC